MCGIAGICRLDGQPLNEDARAHVRAMTDVITYRGPDGSGIWQEGPVSLGHRRLSIIDLSGGSQPMQDVDGELCIVFNGEIYNFAELRQELLQAGARFHSSHSDTEVILQAYRVWGTDCLQRFDGMFAFALWDAPRRRLFCARDRFGKKYFNISITKKQVISENLTEKIAIAEQQQKMFLTFPIWFENMHKNVYIITINIVEFVIILCYNKGNTA